MSLGAKVIGAIKYCIFASWNILGFKRGLDSYDYCYTKYYYEGKKYVYTDKIVTGVTGMILYNLTFPIVAYKEVYRLEANIRNFEKDDKYYDLF